MMGACAEASSAPARIAAQSSAATLSLPMRSIVIALSPSCSCVYWQTSATTTWWGDGGGSPFTVTLTSNNALALTETGGIDDEQDCVVWAIVHESAESARSSVSGKVIMLPTRTVYTTESPTPTGESARTTIDVSVHATGAVAATDPSSGVASTLLAIGLR